MDSKKLNGSQISFLTKQGYKFYEYVTMGGETGWYFVYPGTNIRSRRCFQLTDLLKQLKTGDKQDTK